MFDVSRNIVGTLTDDASVTNRVRLLILSDPTSMYNEPEFGVGIKASMWKYNTPNTKAILKDKIKLQLDKFEPSVIAAETQFNDNLLFSELPENVVPENTLTLTVGLRTVYQSEITTNLD